MATTEDSGAIGLLLDNLECKTADVVDADFWRLLPVINVDKTEDIPGDWLGAMGVPLTVIPKNGGGNRGRLALLGMGSNLKVNGRALYKRVIVKDRRPDLPEYIDLAEYVKRYCGARLAVTLVPFRELTGVSGVKY